MVMVNSLEDLSTMISNQGVGMQGEKSAHYRSKARPLCFEVETRIIIHPLDLVFGCCIADPRNAGAFAPYSPSQQNFECRSR